MAELQQGTGASRIPSRGSFRSGVSRAVFAKIIWKPSMNWPLLTINFKAPEGVWQIPAAIESQLNDWSRMRNLK